MADYKDKAKKIVERKRKSQEFWAPIYDEFAEVQQAAKCRTSPIYKKDKSGKDTNEIDDTRTNVCMPAISIMIRKNTARMTAQPPQLDFISPNRDVADKLTAWHYMQYDLTNEGETRRKTVMQAEMFGIGVEKTFLDNVVVRRKMRVRTKNATRTQLLKYSGKPEQETEYAVQQLGDQLQPNEIAQAVALHGPEFQIEQEIKRYSGPLQKSIFIGDFHIPPGCDDIDTADWLIEEYIADETFFEYWLEQTCMKPEPMSGGMVESLVFDQMAVDQMLEDDKDLPDDEKTSLRKKFRELVSLDTTFQYDRETRCSKKFKILECHYKKDGENWVCWVGNDDTYLGEMPYPVDLNGQWMYTALVPLPDLVSAIGDSTPRLGRFLHRLHNVNTGQRQDLITNFMKPLVFTREGADITDESQDRGAFREFKVKTPNDVNLQQMPQLPQYAWENENAILRQFAMLEPALASSDLGGSNANPQTGRTATVGVLAQRERDTLLQFKVDGMNIFLKKVGIKKLEMLKQTMQDAASIGSKYFNEDTLARLQGETQALSQRSGKPTVITLDWAEIQDDIQVEPKAGSTLSIEDEFHRMGAQTLYQAAQADPETFNKLYAGKAWADTIPNVDSNKAINPPQPPPDPLTQIKQSASYSYDMAKLAVLMPNLFNELIQRQGLTPDPELQHHATLEGIKKVGEAADAVGKLAEPAVRPEPGAEAGIRRTAADRV